MLQVLKSEANHFTALVSSRTNILTSFVNIGAMYWCKQRQELRKGGKKETENVEQEKRSRANRPKALHLIAWLGLSLLPLSFARAWTHLIIHGPLTTTYIGLLCSGRPLSGDSAPQSILWIIHQAIQFIKHGIWCLPFISKSAEHCH